MGKSLDKIVYTIKNQLTGHAPADDSRLGGEFIEDQILDVRSILIKDSFIADRYLNDDYFQHYDGLLIETVKQEMPSGISDEYPELFSVLPALVTGVGFSNIKYLGTQDGRHSFTRLSMSGFISTDGRQFTSEESFYTVNGAKAQYKNLPNLGMTYAKMIAVVYDPRVVPNFDRTLEFPVPAGMIHKLELIVLKQMLSTLGIPPDVLNDAQDVMVNDKKK